MMIFNFIKKIIRGVKNLFERNKMSYEFKSIKVADIEKEINLKEKGESDGKKQSTIRKFRGFFYN